MGYIYFTLPYVNALESEQGWKRDPDAEHTYSIIRGHYALREHQLNEPTKKGEVVGALTSLRGVTQKKTEAVEYEYTAVEMVESIKESLREEEITSEVISLISSSLGADKIVKLSGELKSALKVQLKESFKNSFRVQTTETLREKKTRTWEYTIDPEKFEPNATIAAVKAYKRYSLDLYLVFLDYLFIEYRRPPFGVRLRRNKAPSVKGTVHPNLIRLDLPLSSIVFWKQVPDSLLLVNEKDYRIEVDDPFETNTQELNVSKTFPVQLPPKPTLYDLSEKTFPMKRWV
ncbi:MAG: hypothetical protein LAO31_10185 [Acidobacteriia bacterium]|nr:hypothetical protein [Terriglobia bacterium]